MTRLELRQQGLLMLMLFLGASVVFWLSGNGGWFGSSVSNNIPAQAATPLPLPTASTAQAMALRWNDPELPFYGMEFVPVEQLGLMQEMGINMVLHAFDYDSDPDDWLAYLDAARQHDMRVIGQLWPEGWAFDRDSGTWQIDARAELFIQTVAEHPAFFAVYALHEPYWNGCDSCGYTTAEQQALYQAIKALADVPVYSEIDSMAYWTAQGPATAFADGICDYCQTLYYPFRSSGAYERDKLIAQLEADLATARERAPNSRIIWTMQGFAQGAPYFLRMPTSEEMFDLASVIYSYDEIAGAWWYPWIFDDEYSDFLAQRPELHPSIRLIYEQIVLPQRPAPTPTVTTTATSTANPAASPTVSTQGGENSSPVPTKAGEVEEFRAVLLPFVAQYVATTTAMAE